MSFTEVTTVIPIHQGGQIWLRYPRIRDALAPTRRKRMRVIITTGLISFSNDENYVIFLFSERTVKKSVLRLQRLIIKVAKKL